MIWENNIRPQWNDEALVHCGGSLQLLLGASMSKSRSGTGNPSEHDIVPSSVLSHGSVPCVTSYHLIADIYYATLPFHQPLPCLHKRPFRLPAVVAEVIENSYIYPMQWVLVFKFLILFESSWEDPDFISESHHIPYNWSHCIHGPVVRSRYGSIWQNLKYGCSVSSTQVLSRA